MSVMMILVAGLCAIALAWWAFRRSSTKLESTAKMPVSASLRSASAPAPSAPPAQVATVAPTPTEPAIEVPVALAGFQWRTVRDLEGPRLEALLEAIKGIPRPPHSLQRLLSPEFVANASSNELSELVMGEPLIAAKVLATVNSPLYGLQKPVSGMGQAVTFLGMSTVRNICVQYMLAEAFKPRLAVSRRTFDGIWRASAIASELCVRLSKALNLPDQGALSTQVVLGFVGHLAAASLMPPEALKNWLSLDRLERARREQGVMDLSAGEVGGLLMQTWGMPTELVDGVREIDRVLVTPPSQPPKPDAPRRALSYLCARLGERLALGQLKSLRGYDPQADAMLDTFYLNQHLRHPALRQLSAALDSVELQEAIAQMLSRDAPSKGQ